MNPYEETPAARTLLDIANSDPFAARDRLQVYQSYQEMTAMQAQIGTEIRGIREPNRSYSDYTRRRNALMAQVSYRTLHPMTRTLAQNQLDALNSDYNTGHSPFRDSPKPIDVERLLSTEGMVLYGSRALNVNRNSSDYDLAFSYESHRMVYEYLKVNNTPISHSTSYFTSVPEAGYHTFFQYMGEDTKIDIIFVHNDEDLDVIRSSIQDLQSIPSYMLHDKHFRIEAYNRALQHRGWKPLVNAQRSERILSRQRRASEEARSAIARAIGTSIW